LAVGASPTLIPQKNSFVGLLSEIIRNQQAFSLLVGYILYISKDVRLLQQYDPITEY
jgi:hypothetical protein